MKNLFVSYEIAVLLKETDFNEPCICQYLIQDSTFEMSSPKVINLVPLVTSKAITVGILPKQVELNLCAPLYQQVVDWFLDKHKIYITEKANVLLTHFSCKVWKSERKGDTTNQQGKWTETYPYGLSRYEALDMAIIEALKLI